MNGDYKFSIQKVFLFKPRYIDGKWRFLRFAYKAAVSDVMLIEGDYYPILKTKYFLKKGDIKEWKI